MPSSNRRSQQRRAVVKAEVPLSRQAGSGSLSSTAPSSRSRDHRPRRNSAPWAGWCARVERCAPSARHLTRHVRNFPDALLSIGPRATSLRLLCAGALAILSSLPATAGKMVVDSSGRRVEVPDRIERVIAAGPPASVLMTIVAPEKLIGWNRKPPPEELPYLPAMVRSLPEIGRLTGRGNTANLEVVMAAKPDLIVDFGSISDTYISLADRVQSQTAIPYLLIDGRFAHMQAAVRLLGGILAVTQRADQLAGRMEDILHDV